MYPETAEPSAARARFRPKGRKTEGPVRRAAREAREQRLGLKKSPTIFPTLENENG